MRFVATFRSRSEPAACGGEEIMELEIDGELVATWNVTGTGAYQGQFDTYTADIDGAEIGEIRIRFANDLYLPDQNIDRNLRVDWIRIDGEQYETEDPSVFSTGTWNAGVGVQPGFWESEYLHTNGYFEFAEAETENEPELPGLIGYWNLDDDNRAGEILDSSGLGNDGQASGFLAPAGPSSDVPDFDGGSLGSFQFDGVNDSIEIAESESLRLSNGTYTQSLWIKSTSTDDAYHGVMGYQEGALAGTRYPFIYVRNDAIYAGFGTGGNSWKGVIADDVIDIGQWNHVAVSFDGTTMELYVDGESVASNSNFGGSLPTTQIAPTPDRPCQQLLRRQPR